MASKYTKSDIYVIIIVLILMFINTASINMLIPSYGVIIDDFQIKDSWIYVSESVLVLISAIFSIFWGYYTDRIDRSKIVMLGALLSAIGTTYTAFSGSFINLLFARVITGAGVGCVLPVGISILSDIVPPEERSGWFGFLAIFSSLSNASGNAMSAFLAPLDFLQNGRGWQFPFIILAGLAIIVIFLLIFIRLPDIGSKEADLSQLQMVDDVEYSYRISTKELLKMVKKPTNKYLIINGFFSIVPGTVLTYVLITTLDHPTLGILRVLPEDIVVQVSTIMAGMVGVGYLVGNVVLSAIGDKGNKKNKRYRALLAFITQLVAIPLLFLMLTQLIEIPDLSKMPVYPVDEFGQIYIPSGEVSKYMLETLIAIFKNYPNFIWFVIAAFMGSFFGAGFVPNKNAIMIDVNLPEHRGTATSFFQLTEQIGKSITLILTSALLAFMTYKNMLYVAILFWVPSGLLWFAASRKIQKDLDDKAMILRERTQDTFIDFFFELEIAIDDGIQIIQDAKDILITKPKSAEILIDKAINRFKFIFKKARDKNLTDIENQANTLLSSALLLKNDLLMLTSKPSKENLQILYNKIDATWEESDFGKIEVLYESAYLKVIEARLRRNYNPIDSSRILQSAISVYDRVIRLAGDREVDDSVKKLSDDEMKFQERIHRLLNLSQKSKVNTIELKSKLDDMVNTLIKENITRNDLEALIELTSDYGLPLQEIALETFEGKTSREIRKTMKEIDDLFKAYDDWQSN